jgi:ABC-type phosphate transport system auxiliary subunit
MDGMRTLSEIRTEIDRLSDRRVEVMRSLSQEFTADLKAEHLELEDRIAELWEEQRNARAMLRHGDRDLIIQRARQDERLSRAA